MSIVANRGADGGIYGTTWELQGNATQASTIEGAIYHGTTPGGGFATRPTGCGNAGISFARGSQVPAIGAYLVFDITGVMSPARVMILGTPTPALPLCPPASCALGTSLAVVLNTGSLQFGVPCQLSLVGSTVAVQGAAFQSPGGCNQFGQVVTTDTVDVTIR